MKRLFVNIHILGLIGSFLFLASCRGDEPPIGNPESEVIFFIDGTIDGNEFLIEAGRENVYLFTDYSLDSNGLYQFKGDFEKTNNCTTNCMEAFSITINNYTTDLNFNMNNALFLGNYSLASNTPDSIDVYDLNFEAAASGSSIITHSTWDFGDGNTSNQMNPSHVYSDVTNALVRFEARDLFGAKSHIEAALDLENNQNCITDFSFIYQDNDFIFRPIGGELPNYTYNWSIVELTDTNPNIINSSNAVLSTSISNGLFQVCLNVTAPNGCSSEVCKNIDGNSQTLANTTFFNYTSTSSRALKNPLSLSQVTIEYTDPNGVIYSNKNGTQSLSPNNYFEIVKVSAFSDNENNQKTKKIEAKVKILLFNDSGTGIELESDDFIFAVAYPD